MKSTTRRVIILIILVALAIMLRPAKTPVVAPTDGDTGSDTAVIEDDEEMDEAAEDEDTGVADNDDGMDAEDDVEGTDDAEGTDTWTVEDTVILNGYVPFDETEYVTALQGTENVALFFHAPRCPTCTALNNDIESNEDTIPADTAILKVDYDAETALKQKYGVTSQHTIVYVDAEGNVVKTERGTPTLEKVLEGFDS